MAKKITENKISDLTVEELINYHKSCIILKERYANMLRRYDGTINPDMAKEGERLISIDNKLEQIDKQLELKVNELI